MINQEEGSRSSHVSLLLSTVIFKVDIAQFCQLQY